MADFACRIFATLVIIAGILLTGRACWERKQSKHHSNHYDIYANPSIRHRPVKLQWFPFLSCDTIVTGMALACGAGTGSHGVIIG